MDEITLVDALKTTSSEGFEEVFFQQEKSREDKMMNLYLKLFSGVSIENEFYGRLSLHLILGQIFKHFKLYINSTHADLRVHPFIIQPSGSGKSVAEAFIQTIAQKVGIPFTTVTGEVNEASLVGSWVQDIRNPTQVVLQEGILKKFEDGGILLFDEGSLLIKAGQKNYNTLLLNYIQAAMNPIDSPSNRIERNLKYGSIVVEPKCSFALLSFPVKENLIEILKMGLFQRASVFMRDLSADEWMKMSKGIKKGIMEAQDQKLFSTLIKEHYDGITKFTNYLNQVKIWSSGLSKLIIMSNNSGQMVDKFIQEMNDLCENARNPIKEIMDSFRNRSIVDIFKFASHRALLSKRLAITDDDLKYGVFITKRCLISILRSLESLEEVAKTITSLEARWNKFKSDLQFLKVSRNKDGTIPTNDLLNLISKYFALSKPSAFRLLEGWEEKGLVRWLDKGKKDSRVKL